MQRAELPALPTIPEDFGSRDEHALLVDGLRRSLQAPEPHAELARLDRDPLGFSPERQRGLAELGLFELARSADEAGDPVGLVLVLDELGRTLCPGPFVETLLARELLGHDPAQRARCDELARGERWATVALEEPGGRHRPQDLLTRADRSALHGTKAHVAWAEGASAILVPARTEDGFAVLVVEPGTPGVTIDPEQGVDRTRRMSRVVLDGARAVRVSGSGERELEAALDRARLLLAAELCGVIEAVLGLTRDYAQIREQFGRKIGSFQAVSHPLADTLVDLELARSLVLGAAAAQSGTDTAGARLMTLMAQHHAAERAHVAVQRGVQLHGGYGFTLDCPVHYYFKRALASRGRFGGGAERLEALATALLGAA